MCPSLDYVGDGGVFKTPTFIQLQQSIIQHLETPFYHIK
jgi:hypothetical protein